MTVKRITQDTFDAAVRENMDTFEMEEGEAITSAIEEFEIQGVDLKGIIKSKGGGNTENHPATIAVKALGVVGRELESKEGDEGLIKAVRVELEKLEAAITSDDKDALADILVVAGNSLGVEFLLGVARAAGTDEGLLTFSLRVLNKMIHEDANKTRFRRAAGPALMCHIMGGFKGSEAVVRHIADVCATSTWKHEDNKIDLMMSGVDKLLVDALASHCDSAPALTSVCQAMNGLARADDDRPAASQAFQNARAMAKLGAHEHLVAGLRRHKDGPDAALSAALCATLKRVAVNEDICKKVADLGGVPLLLSVANSSAAETAACARSCCQVLRQLAGSDSCKALIVAEGGYPIVTNIVARHRTNSQVLEQSIGIFAACCLRAPELAEKAFSSGLIEVTMEVMAEQPKFQWAQRAWCLMIRNMVSRSVDLRPAVLEKGVEPLLRAARSNNPEQCTDVASAALRDLGFDNYNGEEEEEAA